MKKSFQDEMLPVQKKQCCLYKGSKNRFLQEMYSTILGCCDIQDPCKEFNLETSSIIPMEKVISNPIALKMLESIVTLSRPKKILEIGTFIGVSTMSMAKALPKGGKMVTVEKFGEMARIAKRNFLKNGFKNKITLIEGAACEQAAKIKKLGPFDMVFIDGDKREYWDYFLMADSVLSSGGLIMMSDIFFYGDALNRHPSTSKGTVVRKTMLKMKTLKKYHKLILPLADGYLFLMRVR